MNRRFFFLAMQLAALTAAEVVDRIAVSLDRRVITESAIRRHLALEAFQRRVPVDMSMAARRAAAESLINQALVLNEMTLLRYPRPAVPEAAKYIAELRTARQMDEKEFQAELARYAFTLEDLQEQVIWQLTLLAFVDFRFRPGVQISDEELQRYYDSEMKGKPQAPSLDDARQSISRLLTEVKVNEAMSSWLTQMRKTTRVKYYEEAFQ